MQYASPVKIVNISGFERLLSVAAGSWLVLKGATQARGTWLIAAGAELLRRGISGHCYVYQAFGLNTSGRSRDTSVPYELGVRVDASVMIRRPRMEVYAFWRNFANLPKIAKHIESVQVLDNKRSRWTIKGLRGSNLTWESDIINEVPGELIGWRSLPGSDIDHAGSVQFKDAPGGGTEVKLELQYNPPAGYVGAYLAKILGHDPQIEIQSELRRFKYYMESGAARLRLHRT